MKKICNKCNIEKDITLFNKKKRSRREELKNA